MMRRYEGSPDPALALPYSHTPHFGSLESRMPATRVVQIQLKALLARLLSSNTLDLGASSFGSPKISGQRLIARASA